MSCGRKPEERGVYFDAAVGLSFNGSNLNNGIEKGWIFSLFFRMIDKIMVLGGMA